MSKRILLLSGGTGPGEKESLSIIRSELKQNSNVLYVPSDERDKSSAQKWADHFKSWLSKAGNFKVSYTPVATLPDLATSAGSIFLSGGPTFHFLQELKQSGGLHAVSESIESGKFVFGMSAGAMALTPSIVTASTKVVGDENTAELTDLTGAGKTDFLFCPHFKDSSDNASELKKLSTKERVSVIAASDGGGVFLRDGRIRRVGRVKDFVFDEPIFS